MNIEIKEIETEENNNTIQAEPGVFSELDDKKICYAVFSYKNKLRFQPKVKKEDSRKLKYNEGTDKVSTKNVRSISYEVLILKKDKIKIEETPFHKVYSSDHDDVVTHEMIESEILYFKENLNKFINVVDDINGAVYELKTKSFWEYRNKNLVKNIFSFELPGEKTDFVFASNEKKARILYKRSPKYKKIKEYKVTKLPKSKWKEYRVNSSANETFAEYAKRNTSRSIIPT